MNMVAGRLPADCEPGGIARLNEGCSKSCTRRLRDGICGGLNACFIVYSYVSMTWKIRQNNEHILLRSQGELEDVAWVHICWYAVVVGSE